MKLLKLPTYQEIKNLTDQELKQLYLKMDIVPLEQTNDTFFNKFRAVNSEIVKRELGYFDSVDNFHFIY